ncbi:MAG: hypothetical protein LBL38_03470 [Lactobacillales bacterium]|jgi:hypothetical protein|nr:hypothetical protein [Lactobacillales bacterium]
MVIVTFVDDITNPQEAHCCVAFAADDGVNAAGVYTAGNESLLLYNPWGNSFPVVGNNPLMTQDIANGLGGAPENWDIYQYTTFNY